MGYSIKNFQETKSKNGVNLALYQKDENGEYSNVYCYVPNKDEADRLLTVYGVESRAVCSVRKDEKTGKRYALIKINLEYVPDKTKEKKNAEAEKPKELPDDCPFS